MSSDNPLLNITDRIDYEAVRPEHIDSAVREGIARVNAALEAASAPETPADWEHVDEPIDLAVSDFARTWGAVAHLQSVVDTPELRAAYNEALPLVTETFIRLSQSEALFAKYRAIRDSAAFASLSPVRQRIVNRDIRDFVLSGAALPEEKRARVKAIGERLSLLSQKFSENLLDATNAFSIELETPERLKGVPEDTLALYASLAAAQGKTGYRITLQFPSYLPLMRYCEDRSLRETCYRAFATRASEFDGGAFDNTPLMKEILELRAEEARLLGFGNFGELSLTTKMAESPAEVIRFLENLAGHARPAAERDMAELSAFAREKLGLEKLESWDIAYASERLRETRYSYSDAEVKRYFTESAVFEGLFRVVGTLFGIEIRPGKASVWHPDVKVFDVLREGQVIASFYADLYAREGKRSGAWMDGERTRALRRGKLDTPIAYLVCNFTPGVDGAPATLTHDDVTTLFHEFGHTLHHLLTAQTEGAVSGINGVEWDAVELPSQFLENFAWERSVVKSLSRHVETGETIPDELFDKMLAAKHFQAGMACVRQVEFALFDMKLHAFGLKENETIQDVLDAVREEVAVSIPPRWNRFAQSFSHIFAGGYAAGYYSYKWAEVLSCDAFSAFEETGVLNPETGRRYLREILERGSSRDAMENFVAFRGRKPTIDALLRLTGIEAKA